MGYNNDAMGYIRGYMMGYIMGYTVTNDDLRSVRGDRRPRQCHRWPNQYAMAQHRAEPIGDQAAKSQPHGSSGKTTAMVPANKTSIAAYSWTPTTSLEIIISRQLSYVCVYVYLSIYLLFYLFIYFIYFIHLNVFIYSFIHIYLFIYLIYLFYLFIYLFMHSVCIYIYTY